MVATLGAIGCNLGSVLAYEVGAYGGRPLIERFGKYILMNRHDLDVSERFFQKYGSITVFIGRLLPVVRTFIALPAGIARMPRGKFHLYTFAGSWPWCFALAYFGFVLGVRWDTDPRLKHWLHRFDAVIVLALVDRNRLLRAEPLAQPRPHRKRRETYQRPSFEARKRQRQEARIRERAFCLAAYPHIWRQLGRTHGKGPPFARARPALL